MPDPMATMPHGHDPMATMAHDPMAPHGMHPWPN